jgi:hypothetical protein
VWTPYREVDRGGQTADTQVLSSSCASYCSSGNTCCFAAVGWYDLGRSGRVGSTLVCNVGYGF